MSPVPHHDRRLTWADYRRLPESERAELVDGELVAMSPSPTARHQDIVSQVVSRLRRHLAGKPCRAFAAPLDVKLSDHDVVQPDVLVVCDPRQFRETHIEGPPALVVEVLSPSSVQHDRQRKLKLYAHYGVRECWLITPVPLLVEVLVLTNGEFRECGRYETGTALRSILFPRLRLALAELADYPAADNVPGWELRKTMATASPVCT